MKIKDLFRLTYLLAIAAVCFSQPLLPTSLMAAGNVTSTMEVLRRQCIHKGGDSWECDNQHVRLSTLVARIQDTANGGGASKKAYAYFYTNLREPTADENSGSSAPAHSVHQRWIWLWFARRGISFDKIYGAFNGIDPKWYERQVLNTDTHGPLDVNDLEQDKVWPFPNMLPAAQILEMCFMQALAAAAINPDVYFFTQRGASWQEYSHWALVEFWKLTQNKNVQRIWRVDPSPPGDGSTLCSIAEPELLWDRVKDKELQPGWVCPVKEA